MRYKLYKVSRSSVSSAYCPVCTVKTVEITGELKPQWIGEPFNGYHDGLVSPENLCCKGECVKAYKKRIRVLLKGQRFVESWVAQGGLPRYYKGLSYDVQSRSK